MFRVLMFFVFIFYCWPVFGQDTADTKFWLANSFMAGATVYDIESTILVLNNCPIDMVCIEKNPLVRPFMKNSRWPIYTLHSTIDLGIGTVSYFLKKKGGKLWWLAPISIGTIHAVAGTHNVRFALSWK